MPQHRRRPGTPLIRTEQVDGAKGEGRIFRHLWEALKAYDEKELDLLRKLEAFPREVKLAADMLAPHRLTSRLGYAYRRFNGQLGMVWIDDRPDGDADDGDVAAAAVGYVMGTKAGRQRFEQISGTYRACAASASITAGASPAAPCSRIASTG